MKKILLTIVTCIQNEKRIFNQVSNLKSYKLPENLTVVFCFGSNYDDRYAELLKDYKTLKVDTEEQYLFRALKTKKIFESIVNFDYDYIIKIDDDTILNYDLINSLNLSFDYIGRFQNCDRESFIQIQLYKFNIFDKIDAFTKVFTHPFKFATGDCYCLSKKAVNLINNYMLPKLNKEDFLFLNEDQLVGFILSETGITYNDIKFTSDITFKHELQITQQGFSIHPVAENVFVELIKKNFEEQLSILQQNILKNLSLRKIYTKKLKDNILKAIIDFINEDKKIGLG
jgi:hypothetical protein